MTKIKYTMIIFFIFFVCSIEIGLSSCDYLSGCCCKSPMPPYDEKCYTSGECCLMDMPGERWDSVGCRDFSVRVEPKRIMLTLGTRTPVILYIDNFGTYTDAYNVEYTIDSGNPSLINVDLTGLSPTGSVFPSGIKSLYPLITVLTANNAWDVTFKVTSIGDSSMYRTATLRIMQSDSPLSLPEFGIFGLIEILILVFTICFIDRIR